MNMENDPNVTQDPNGIQQHVRSGRKRPSRILFLLGLLTLVLIAGTVVLILQYSKSSSTIPEPTTLQAAPPKVWKIGVLVFQDSTLVELGAFQQKMEDLGHTEGGDIEYVIKNAKGDNEISKQHNAEFFADKSFDLVLSLAQSYRGFNFKGKEDQSLVTKTVLSNVSNFEPLGLSGLYSPTMNEGRNFTAVLCGNVDFVGKRMELLKDIVPEAKVVGLLVNPSREDFENVMTLSRQAAAELGVELRIVEVTADEAPQRAKEEFTADTVDGIVWVSVGMKREIRNELATHFVEIGIPYITFSHTNPVVPNYIAAVANDPPGQARQAASMVHKIMNGVAVDDIPIEFAQNLEIHINTAIAKKAGIEIPQSVLIRADIINTKL